MIIGLTGGIATGKTTVARMLEERGATIVDADQLAHAVEEPDQPAYHDIVERFGRAVLLPDGRIDRARLGRLVFADEQARKELERFTHPRIRTLIAERVAEAVSRGAPLIVVDIPLLFETGGEDQFNGVLLVYAPEAVQIERLRERSGFDSEDARRRLAAQLPIEEKRSRATWVIDNGGAVESTRDLVSRWWGDVVSG
jgi:dephospho-CoA kinase